MSARSQEKRMTIEAQVLRHLRISRRISLNKAGRICNITGSAIVHMEQGRMDISSARLETMVLGYGYTMDEFYEYLDGKAVPKNFRDECLIMLRDMDDSKLSLVHGLLTNMSK